MITKDKLAYNLKVLKSRIPDKPEAYTSEHPKKINEALKYYCNRRTVHGIQACTKNLNDANWPLPLWFNPENVKVGFWNKLYYKKQYKSWKKGKKFNGLKEFDFFWVPLMNNLFFKRPFDEILSEAFDANSNYAFKGLSLNPILQSKQMILESIQKSYKRSDWVACISTIFPLIDFVTRKILKTNNLGIDVSKICKLFEQNGFSLENAGELMPHFTFVSSHQLGQPLFTKEREEWFEKMSEHDFGLIGPPLSSFIRFANIYYSYYKEDKDKNDEVLLLNRHAILHSSSNNFGSKANTIKLLTFLYLMLELESVFEILFCE
jgi:hypothetical protein